jgi:hypothetical protein
MIQHAQRLHHILVGCEDNFENALAKAINITELV